MAKIFCALLFAVAVASSVQAASFFVDAARADDMGDGTSWGTAKKTIQSAVDLATTGDLVLVTNGVYDTGTTITPGYFLKNRVVITNAITVRSVNGPELTVIKGSGTSYYNSTSAVRCVYMKSGTLDGFTLDNGATYGMSYGSSNDYDRVGGGVNMYNAETSTIVTNCMIRSCKAYIGGGSCYGLLNTCLLTNNVAAIASLSSASGGGGAYYSTLVNCMLTVNSTIGNYCYGGGAYRCSLTDCTLTGNKATYGGGGSYGGSLTGCTLSGNSVNNGFGGGSYNSSLTNCMLTGNSANVGGGGSYGGSLTGCTLSGNSATNSGGGSYGGSLTGCTLSGNSVNNGFGGGSYNSSLTNCMLTGNSANVGGGGSYGGALNNCTLTSNTGNDGGGSNGGTLSDCTLTGNTGVNGGGSNGGTLNNCELYGNAATSGGGAYGGTLNDCTLYGNTGVDGGGANGGTLNRCTVRDNTAYSNGGGAYGSTLFDSTVTRNVAHDSGGGLYNGTLNRCELVSNAANWNGGGCAYGTINNALIYDNEAIYGGGVYGGTLVTCTVAGNVAMLDGGGSYGGVFTGCIVWDNTLIDGMPDNYFEGSFDYSCTSPLLSGRNLASSPHFVDAERGDFRLCANSPCIDRGGRIDVGLWDVAGNPRVVNGTMDMGAYEWSQGPVANPVVVPVDGTVFATVAQKVLITCATPDATIYYTIDGCMPTTNSGLYSGAFNISETTTVKAFAARSGLGDSAVVSATIWKYEAPVIITLPEALDVPTWSIETGGAASWTPVTNSTYDGISAASSGSSGNNSTNWIKTTVSGPGTLTFWWKTSCENDPDSDNWDYVVLMVDHAEICRLDGITDWQRVSISLADGTHSIRWEYRKDETLSGGEDRAWVDHVSFVLGSPAATVSSPVAVPYAWLGLYPGLMRQADGDYEVAALADVDGDGHATWQEFVTGSDPTNRESILRTLISMSNDTPYVTWIPDLSTARVYIVEGKTNLNDRVWWPTNANSRFFRVNVDMP